MELDLTEEMDFMNTMEAYAEAWVAANTQTAVTDQSLRHTPLEELPTMVNTEQLLSGQGHSPGAIIPPPGGSTVSRARSHDPASSHMTKHDVHSASRVPSPPSGVKAKPIHCVVETPSGGRPGTPPSAKLGGGGGGVAPGCEGSHVEMDTYAILPNNTLFGEVVRVALVKLGYSSAEAIGAKGAIQIRNWKPLTFDTITENPDATVAEILGDVTSVATLRIKLASRTKSHSVDGVKEKLLQFLLQHSQSMLMSTGCPIDKNFLSAIGKGEYPATMPEDMRRAFERWYREQTRGSGGHGRGGGGHSPTSPATTSPESGKENRLDPGSIYGAHFPPGYPALRGELNSTHFSRTRIRTSFDPDLEIPRLQRWFEQNQHPTRDQMIFYLNELNSLESRRGRKPLDLTNIIYWFKNARAAQRRAHRGGTPEVEAETDERDISEMDESLPEDRLSPDAIKREPPSQQLDSNLPLAVPTNSESEDVPVLPNRNAVYVVNEPLHLYKKEDVEGDSNVVHIEPEDPADQKVSSPPPQQQDGNSNKENNNSSSSNGMEAGGGGGEHPAVGDLPAGDPKSSPRECNSDSGNGSDADPTGVNLTLEPRSPPDTPQNLSLPPGSKRGCESLDSDMSEDELDGEGYNGGHYERYRSNGGGSENGGSESPSGSSGQGLSPLSHGHAGLIPGHPLLGPHAHSPHGQPPPAHQQALQLHPHHAPHLPHPLNMHLFPHPLYNHIDASALMGGAPKPYKDSPSPTSMSEDHRKKRSRVFIDPLTEIPKLEKWFLEDTHPSSYMIEKYTEDLNRSDYRQRFPKLEPKNVQLWFKNHRAKVKRQRFEHSAEMIQQQQHSQAQGAEGVVHSAVAPKFEPAEVHNGAP